MNCHTWEHESKAQNNKMSHNKLVDTNFLVPAQATSQLLKNVYDDHAKRQSFLDQKTHNISIANFIGNNPN